MITSKSARRKLFSLATFLNEFALTNSAMSPFPLASSLRRSTSEFSFVIQLIRSSFRRFTDSISSSISFLLVPASYALFACRSASNASLSFLLDDFMLTITVSITHIAKAKKKICVFRVTRPTHHFLLQYRRVSIFYFVFPHPQHIF